MLLARIAGAGLCLGYRTGNKPLKRPTRPTALIRYCVMAIAPKTTTTTNTVGTAPAPAMSDLDKVLAALAVQPTAKDSALLAMVKQVCKANNVDYDKLSAGMKSSWTRRVKLAAEASGVTF
jgi:hypothetical protein